MKDPVLDALAESARNRGVKLVRSRVRTGGKRRFGKVGLTDPSGEPVFGMDTKGPTANPDEVEDYLRTLAVGDWGASLDAPAPRPDPQKSSSAPSVGPKSPAAHPPPRRPVPKPAPKPAPTPLVRPAKKGDAPAATALIALLDHQVEPDGVRKRIAQLIKDGLPPLVATLGKDLVGLCGICRMTVVHRDRPVGRITILVVAEHARGRGIGRMLVAAAEEELRAQGCGIVEVTSNDRLAEAHAFYRHMGYERTSIRFCRPI